MNQATPFRHDDIFVGFGPIDELHREFQMLLDRLIECEDADYGQHLLELHEHLLRHCGHADALDSGHRAGVPT